MKKNHLRVLIMAVLTVAFGLSVPNNAAADCVNLSTMFDAMGTCDSNYWSGVSPYYDVVYNNPSHCNSEAETYANNQCSVYDPDYATCWANAYATYYNACVASATTIYYSSINNYSSCLYAAENPTCFERVDFCDAARQRASACEQYANAECCTYSECLNSSGIWQCE
jgi:hypothetical protein